MKFAEFLQDQDIFQNGYQSRQPYVSIVMPTYRRNAEGFLTKCIESVLNQSFTNFEFIIVDDGSSDGSQAVINNYARVDPRIVYVRHEVNSGLPAVRTDEGILLARAPYVAFIFDDNLWFPHTLEVTLSTVQSSGVDFVYGLVEMDQKDEKIIFGVAPLTSELLPILNTIPNGGVLCHRRFFEIAGLYDPHLILRRVCDWDLWLRALQHGLRWQRIDQVLGVELGAVSPNSLGNTVALDYKVTLAYMFASDKNGERTETLRRDSILNYDVFDTEKLMPFVRNLAEWEQVRASIYDPFFHTHPAFHYSPPLRHNRRYDSNFNRYRINPQLPIFSNRKRILILTNRVSRIVQDWVDALTYEPDNIVAVVREWSWALFAPQDIDQLILIDCDVAALQPFLIQCQDHGVSVISVIVHGMDRPYKDARDPLAEVNLTHDRGLHQTFKEFAYFSFPGVPWTEARTRDAQSLLESSDQVVVLDESNITSTVKSVTPHRLGFIPNSLDDQAATDTPFQLALYLADANQMNEESLDAVERLLTNTPASIPRTVYVLAEKSLPAKLQDLHNASQIFRSLETLPSLIARGKRTVWAVPQNIVQRYPGYHRLLMEEDLARNESCLIALGSSDLQAPLTQEKFHHQVRFLRANVSERSEGFRHDARFLYLLNISRGVTLRKNIIGPAQQQNARSVKSMVLINSQAFAGSEAYGLLVAKALADIGFAIQTAAHASFDPYPQGMSYINDWLQTRHLSPILQAEYGKVSRSLSLPEVPEESLQQYANDLSHWLDTQGIRLVFSSGFISEPMIGWKEERLFFMALFAPWDYHLNRMGYLRHRVNGVVSDTQWAADLWGRWMPPPIACVPSMVERDYFQIRNAHLPTTPICIALTGTIQPRKRQREGVFAVRNLVKQGYDLRLHLYGYELSGLQQYIKEVKELAADPILKDRVIFHGFVDDPMEIPRNNHIILIPSTDESLPQGMIFNQAAGLLAVACPAGGIEEMIEDGVTGFLARGFTTDDCTEALRRALDRQAEWPAIIAQARRVIRDRCSEQIFTARLLDVMNRGTEIHRSEGRRYFSHLDHSAKALSGNSVPQNEKRSPRRSSNLIDVANLVIGPDINHKPLRYVLACEENYLAGCSFRIGTFQTRPRGSLKLSLIANGRQVLREVTVDLLTLNDNQWTQIEFDPIHNSAGQVFTIRIHGDVQNGRVALYESFPTNAHKTRRIARKGLLRIHRLFSLSFSRSLPTFYPIYDRSAEIA